MLRSNKWLAPLLIIAILIAAAYRENQNHPIEFWNNGLMDYPGLSLAHALNMDFWLSGPTFLNGRRVNFDNTMHPGFPFQVSSWVGYRLAFLGTDLDARGRCEDAFANPSSFWLATRLIAVVISLVVTCLYVRAAYRNGILYSLAVGLSYFCYEGGWDYSIRLLSNETFALPLGLAVVVIAGRSLSVGMGMPAIRWWGAWGAVCALCWLNKLNYLVWTVAVVPAWGFYYFARRPSIANLGMQIMAFVMGFSATAYILAKLVLGAGGLAKILRLHQGVLTHSGHFGGGSAEIVSHKAIWTALQSLMAFWPFLLLACAVCALSASVLYSLIRRGKAATSNAALIVYLLCAASLFFAAVLKHYGPHYLVAGVPTIGLLLLAIGEHLHRKVRLMVCAAVGVVFFASYHGYTNASEARYRHEVEVKKGMRSFDELRGHPDDVTLWTYRVPKREFCLELLQSYAGVPEVSDIIENKFPYSDLVLYPWDLKIRVRSESVPFEYAKWKYAVFDKAWFAEYPTEIREFFEKQCRRIVDESSVWVFERKNP